MIVESFLTDMKLDVLVCLRCTGGEVGATSSLAPKIGPLGLVSILRNGLKQLDFQYNK